MPSKFLKMLDANSGINKRDTVYDFICEIAYATKDSAAAWKPNIAFYEGMGLEYNFDGTALYLDILKYLADITPEIPVIMDIKRGDIGATNKMYAILPQKVMNEINPNIAITINPYFGDKAYDPFLELGITIFWLIRTSNPGSDRVQKKPGEQNEFLWQDMFEMVLSWQQMDGQCGAVFGATHPDEFEWVREHVPSSTPLLLPGIGTQGGDMEATGKILKEFEFATANSSSGIMYAHKKGDDSYGYQTYASMAAKETAAGLK